MKVLVDTSVWVDYFRSGKKSALLDDLIDQNLVVTNVVILAEIIPALRVSGHAKVVKMLEELKVNDFAPNWAEIMWVQTQCLRSGHNGIGIPDIMIGQNASQNKSRIWSLDRHFRVLSKKVGFQLFGNEGDQPLE